MKTAISLLFFIISFGAFAQKKDPNFKVKRIAVKDSIIIDSVSINPTRFALKTKQNKIIDTSLYNIDFAKSILKFKQPVGPLF